MFPTFLYFFKTWIRIYIISPYFFLNKKFRVTWYELGIWLTVSKTKITYFKYILGLLIAFFIIFRFKPYIFSCTIKYLIFCNYQWIFDISQQFSSIYTFNFKNKFKICMVFLDRLFLMTRTNWNCLKSYF